MKSAWTSPEETLKRHFGVKEQQCLGLFFVVCFCKRHEISNAARYRYLAFLEATSIYAKPVCYYCNYVTFTSLLHFSSHA